MKTIDPEQELNEAEGSKLRLDDLVFLTLTTWVVYVALMLGIWLAPLLNLLAAAGKAVGRWFSLQRVCGWCDCHLGGNPLAGQQTHGICEACRAKVEAGVSTRPMEETR